MKNKLIDMLDNLNGFLDNMKAIAEHPYSLGLDSSKLITDLKAYISNMKNLANQLPEEKVEKVEEEQTEKNK